MLPLWNVGLKKKKKKNHIASRIGSTFKPKLDFLFLSEYMFYQASNKTSKRDLARRPLMQLSLLFNVKLLFLVFGGGGGGGGDWPLGLLNGLFMLQR